MWASLGVGITGLWLMIAPSVLAHPHAGRINDWVVGPVVATIGFIAIAEATRPLVRAAAGAGLWLLIAPWLLGYEPLGAWLEVVAGLVIIALSLMARPMDPAKFGGGWSVVWNPVLRRKMYAELVSPVAAHEAREWETGSTSRTEE